MNSVLRRTAIWSIITLVVATTTFIMGQPGGGGAAPAVAAAQDDPAFPAGDSRKLVMDSCSGCHDLDMVKTAKHDLAAWNETLTHMVAYGAPLTDAQLPTVAAYLAKAFPVAGKVDDKKVDDKKENPDVAGERILNTACTTCHDLGPITRRADDKASWESIVYGMVGNGADVKDADIPVLVDYLVKNWGPPKEAPAAPARGGAPARGAAPAGR
jgi:cytochrome c5